MLIAPLTKFINTEFYNDNMIDGTIGKRESPEVAFVKNIFQETFNVDGNFAFISVEESRSFKEETSLYNKTTQCIAFETFMAIHRAREKNDALKEGKLHVIDSVNVIAISPYKAEADMLSVQLDKIGNPKFRSITEAVSQGLGASVVILTIPNSKELSTFPTDKRRLLVELTRKKVGILVFMTKGCLLPKTFNLDSENALLIQKPEIARLLKLFKFFESNDAVVHVTATDYATCDKCGRLAIGHLRAKCNGQRVAQDFFVGDEVYKFFPINSIDSLTAPEDYVENQVFVPEIDGEEDAEHDEAHGGAAVFGAWTGPGEVVGESSMAPVSSDLV
ncbi:hypothetical protein VTL71DRAFT_16136 [Oculimacula yallundae]|uniref:DNA2/NAM7 helicase-like C-terminal domain-containing protein n=1 Tax=Oculimacula yallundae TaxID=86028 RepID=A0ABR4CDL3_9HELO